MKTLGDFNYDFQPTAPRDVIAHLATGAYLQEGCNIVLLGPPGTGKPHLATVLGVKARGLGHRVLSSSATTWVNRLTASYRAGNLTKDLAKLRRYPLLIVDEVGYIPFETKAANLFFQLVSSRYEHTSLILTSNLPFSGWGEVFGNHVVASAMIDPIVHHVRSHHPQRQQLPAQKHKHDTSQRKTREQGRIMPRITAHFSLRKMGYF